MLLYTPCRDIEQQMRLQTVMIPIVKSLLFKCADSNRYVHYIYICFQAVMLPILKSLLFKCADSNRYADYISRLFAKLLHSISAAVCKMQL